MPIDLLTLLQRDHGDLQEELSRLLDPAATVAELWAGLDGLRLGLMAHAEAEEIVLRPFAAVPALQPLLAQGRAAHAAQERVLERLVAERPGTAIWRERGSLLRELVRRHAVEEEQLLLPALREHAPVHDYAHLAGAFATERLRQLVTL